MSEIVIRNNSKLFKNIFFLSFLLIYSITITFLCSRLNVSNDEIFSLDTTSYDLKGVIKQSYNFEGQPPLYFLLLSLWRKINSGDFFARLFSVLSVALSSFVFYKLIQLINAARCSRWLIVLFLINPYTVWAALEIRLYAFVLLLSLISIYFILSFYIKGSKKHLYIFIVTCLLGVLTQYLYAYLIISFSLAILIFKGWKAFLRYVIYTLPVGLVLTYNVFYTTDPMLLAYINSVQNTFTERILNVFHSPQNLILGMHLLAVERIFRLAFLSLFIISVGYTYFKWYKRHRFADEVYYKSFNSIMISAFVFLIINSVFFAVTKLDYHDRYLTIAFPMFMLMFILFQLYPFLTRSIIYGTIAICYSLMLFKEYKYQVKEYDIRSLAGYINTIENKNEPICFYHKVLLLQFKHNYEGANMLVPLPDGLKFDSTYLAKIKDTSDLKTSIEMANPMSKSYILINDRTESRFEKDTDIKMLNNYLPTHYHITLDTLFYGHNKNFPLRIRRLEKK